MRNSCDRVTLIHHCCLPAHYSLFLVGALRTGPPLVSSHAITAFSLSVVYIPKLIRWLSALCTQICWRVAWWWNLSLSTFSECAAACHKGQAVWSVGERGRRRPALFNMKAVSHCQIGNSTGGAMRLSENWGGAFSDVGCCCCKATIIITLRNKQNEINKMFLELICAILKNPLLVQLLILFFSFFFFFF